jgi:hypothetical protein
VPSAVVAELAALGVLVREHADARGAASDELAGPAATPHCNKLLLLLQPEASDAARFDAVAYLDCDVLVLGDAAPLLLASVARGRIAYRRGDVEWSRAVFQHSSWATIAALAGLDGRAVADALGWANTGVLVFPPARVPSFLDAWADAVDKVAHWIKVVLREGEASRYFIDTLAFLVAAAQQQRERPLEACCTALPVQANCQLNWPLGDFEAAGFAEQLADVPPLLLQYPQGSLRLLPDGTVRPLSARQLESFPFLAFANEAIGRFNVLVRSLAEAHTR